jgi:acetyltransferase-like isoleucine patch superfamily enzyme
MKMGHLRYILCPHRAAAIYFQRRIGIRFSQWFINFIFQRVCRLNAEAPFQVHFTSKVIMGNGIHIGRNVFKSFAVSGGCYIQGGNGIEIGDDTIFATGVKIISANHDPNNNFEWAKAAPIRIGSRCWIGTNAVIMPTVQLGDDVIVGAGSVVTKSFPPHAIIVGVPARQVPKGNRK